MNEQEMGALDPTILMVTDIFASTSLETTMIITSSDTQFEVFTVDEATYMFQSLAIHGIESKVYQAAFLNQRNIIISTKKRHFSFNVPTAKSLTIGTSKNFDAYGGCCISQRNNVMQLFCSQSGGTLWEIDTKSLTILFSLQFKGKNKAANFR